MKANVPEKIYIQPNAHDRWFEGNAPNDLFVEYIRADVLIEKAAIWLMLNADNYIMDGVEEHSSAMRHDFIEQFIKNAMKL